MPAAAGRARARLGAVGRAVAARRPPPRAAPDRREALRAHERRGSCAAIEEGDFGDADAGRDRRPHARAASTGSGCGRCSAIPAMPLERARAEVWHALAGDLGVARRGRIRLRSLNRRSDNSAMSPRPTTGHVRRPAILTAAAEVIAERGVHRHAHRRRRRARGHVGARRPLLVRHQGRAADRGAAFSDDRFYAELNGRLAELDSARARLARLVELWPAEGDSETVLWMELWVRALRDPAVNATRAAARRALARRDRRRRARGSG